MSDRVDAVLRTLQAYIAACNAGDADAYAATLADDVVICPPGAPQLHGPAAARDFIQQGFFEGFEMEFSAEFDRIYETQDEVMAHGTFEARLAPRDGGEGFTIGGPFFNIFREASPGEWKYSWLIWNLDQPS